MDKTWKIRTVLVAVLGLALAGSVQAQGLGVAVGMNFNKLSDIGTGSSDATLENVQGWHVALWFDLPLGPIGLRPGVRYMDAGSLYKDVVNSGSVQVQEKVDVTLIEVPLELRLRFSGAPFLTPYVLAGPVLRFPTNVDESAEGAFKSFSFAGELGFGLELGAGGLRLFPEIKYTFGLSAFTEDSYTIGGVLFTADETQRLNAVMLSLGVGL